MTLIEALTRVTTTLIEALARISWLEAENRRLYLALDEIVQNSREDMRTATARCEALNAGIAAGDVIPLPRLDIGRMRVAGAAHEEVWR